MMKTLLITFTLLFTLSGCGDLTRPTHIPPEGSTNNQEIKLDGRLDFANIKAEILEPQCINCHTGRHLNYDNYNIVKASVGVMLERMTSNNPTSRMPLGSPALSPEMIARFQQWVDAGAPEFAEDREPDPQTPVANITFSEIKTSILKKYQCTTCHSQYNDFAPVKKALGSIVSFITNDQMPLASESPMAPLGPVSTADKEKLLKWVSQGAPQFMDGSSEPTDIILEPTYLSVRNNIIGPKCTLCHNPIRNRGASLNLNSFSNIQRAMEANPKLIKLDDPHASHLIGAMIGRVNEDDGEFFYDPMPFNNTFDDVNLEVPAVTDDEVKLVEEWIQRKLPYSSDEL